MIHKSCGTMSNRPEKKKKKVKEIDGVLWLLDDHGNKVKKVKKKAKPGDMDSSKHQDALRRSSHHGGRKKMTVKEIDGVLWQVDERGNQIKKVRRKGEAQAEKRRRAKSMGPVPGRRRAQERLEPGDQRFRSSSIGKKHKPGEYIDAKGRKVVIDEDGNKTVFDKNGRKLRPKRKTPPPGPGRDGLSRSLHNKPSKVTLNNASGNYDNTRQKMMMKSSIYESGRFDALWDSPTKRYSGSLKGPMGSKLSALQESPGNFSMSNEQLANILLSPTDLVTKESAAAIMGGQTGLSSRALNSIKDPGLHGSNNASSAEAAKLSKQVTEYGAENRELKSKLMAMEDKVRTLTQQNQKEKSKNVKATTEMLQLKADYQQASDEKHDLSLQLKNLEARLRDKQAELETLESKPANRRITLSGKASGGSDHLVTQIQDLMAENDALLDKLELAKASSSHDIKKKEESILFLNAELSKVREENDMLFRGEAEKDPLMGKLLKQKKDTEEMLRQEKEKAAIRIESLQETVDCLERANATLKKDLERATLVVNDDDDEDVRRAKEAAAAVASMGTSGNARQVKRMKSRTLGAGSSHGPMKRRGSGFWGFNQ